MCVFLLALDLGGGLSCVRGGGGGHGDGAALASGGAGRGDWGGLDDDLGGALHLGHVHLDGLRHLVPCHGNVRRVSRQRHQATLLQMLQGEIWVDVIVQKKRSLLL